MAARHEIAAAALAGVLLGCAATPAPPTRATTLSADEPRYEEACSGYEPSERPPTPEDRRIDAVSAIEKGARLRCAALALA